MSFDQRAEILAADEALTTHAVRLEQARLEQAVRVADLVTEVFHIDPDEPIEAMSTEGKRVELAPNLKQFLGKSSTLTTVEEQDGAPIAFSIATPKSSMDPSKAIKSLSAVQVISGVAPEERGGRLVGRTLHQMHAKLINHGYRFMELDAGVTNGYAQTTRNFYGEHDAIAGRPYPHDDYPTRGIHERFTIDLAKLPENLPIPDLRKIP